MVDHQSSATEQNVSFAPSPNSRLAAPVTMRAWLFLQSAGHRIKSSKLEDIGSLLNRGASHEIERQFSNNFIGPDDVLVENMT